MTKVAPNPSPFDLNISTRSVTNQNFTERGYKENEINKLKRQESELLDEMKSEGRCGKNCIWISYCIFAGAFNGIGAFIYASKYAQYGLVGVGVLGPVTFFSMLSWKIGRELSYRIKAG